MYKMCRCRYLLQICTCACSLQNTNWYGYVWHVYAGNSPWEVQDTGLFVMHTCDVFVAGPEAQTRQEPQDEDCGVCGQSSGGRPQGGQ